MILHGHAHVLLSRKQLGTGEERAVLKNPGSKRTNYKSPKRSGETYYFCSVSSD